MGVLDYTLMNTESEKNINNCNLCLSREEHQNKPQATLQRYTVDRKYYRSHDEKAKQEFKTHIPSVLEEVTLK